MAFNFPSSPMSGQVYGNYAWDGEKWMVIGSDGGPTGDHDADVFNVKDYGATGDGETNDRDAIQAAIDAVGTGQSNRGVTFFPPGIYRVDSKLDLSALASITLRGCGNISHVGGDFHGFTIDGRTDPYASGHSNGVRIEDLSIGNNYVGQNTNITATSSWIAGASKTINCPFPTGYQTGCLVYILDQAIAPMPVFVGVVTSYVPNTSITLNAAVGSGGLTDGGRGLSLCQAYLANGTWTTSSTTITMSVSRPPQAPSGQCLVYDYDRILYGDGTVGEIYTSALGVGTWSGTTVTFLHPVNQGSSGSADRLVFAPLAGCIRLSTTVQGTISKCNIRGFMGVTTSQDGTSATGQWLGEQGYMITTEFCNFACGANSASIGATAIYNTNNSISFYNEFSAWWMGYRASGIGNSMIGGRVETCTYGIATYGTPATGNDINAAGIFAGFSMESCKFAIIHNGSSCTFQDLNILCQNSNGHYGIVSYGGRTVFQSISVGSNFTYYAVYQADPGNSAALTKWEAVTAANNVGLGAWRIPALPWWGTCEQCNNPALVYTYGNLPGVIGGSPPPVEGETYDISNCNTSTFLATAAAGGATSAAHRRVRYNASAAVWQVVG